MLTTQQFIHEIENILEVDEGSIDAGYTLTTSEQLDSISLLSIIALFDDKLGIILSLDKLKEIETVSDLLKLANLRDHCCD